MQQYKAIYKDLPVELVERDPRQPRQDFGLKGDENRLLQSIDQYGIEDPLKVSEIEENRYIIIDGHRRYLCAQKLNLKTIPCRIYPKMQEGEFEARRFEMQNNRRSWKPMEKAASLARIKKALNIKTNRELAELVRLAVSNISNSLQLREERLDYQELMSKLNIPEAYRMEFLRLKSKLRRIRKFEVDDIVKIIFTKINTGIIKNSKSLRKLGKIFLRGSMNEVEINQFLENADMNMDELDQKTLATGFYNQLEQIINSIMAKKKNGIEYNSKEEILVNQLKKIL